MTLFIIGLNSRVVLIMKQLWLDYGSWVCADLPFWSWRQYGSVTVCAGLIEIKSLNDKMAEWSVDVELRISLLLSFYMSVRLVCLSVCLFQILKWVIRQKLVNVKWRVETETQVSHVLWPAASCLYLPIHVAPPGSRSGCTGVSNCFRQLQTVESKQVLDCKFRPHFFYQNVDSCYDWTRP